MRLLKIFMIVLSIASSVAAADNFKCNYNLAGAEDGYTARGKIFEIGTECFKKLEAQFTSIDHEKRMACNYTVAGNVGYSMETHSTTEIPDQTNKRDETVTFDECKKLILDNLSNHFEISYEGKPLIVLVDHFTLQTEVKVEKDSKNFTMLIEKVE